MSRLSERKTDQEKLEETLVKKRNEIVRVNITLKRSDLEWLDKTVEDYNSISHRITSRSEIIRAALGLLKEKDLKGVI